MYETESGPRIGIFVKKRLQSPLENSGGGVGGEFRTLMVFLSRNVFSNTKDTSLVTQMINGKMHICFIVN